MFKDLKRNKPTARWMRREPTTRSMIWHAISTLRVTTARRDAQEHRGTDERPTQTLSRQGSIALFL
jgi:hypothetical protein